MAPSRLMALACCRQQASWKKCTKRRCDRLISKPLHNSTMTRRTTRRSYSVRSHSKKCIAGYETSSSGDEPPTSDYGTQSLGFRMPLWFLDQRLVLRRLDCAFL